MLMTLFSMFDSKDTAVITFWSTSMKFKQAKKITFLDILVKRCVKKQLHHINLLEGNIHWTLYQLAFSCTTQIQNQPYHQDRSQKRLMTEAMSMEDL